MRSSQTWQFRRKPELSTILNKRKISKNASRANTLLQNQSQAEIERMKDYVEERMTPFKTEISKLHAELIENFKGDINLRQSPMVKCIRNLQSVHESIVKKYAQLKVINNKNEAKLDSQVKLAKHLEETLSSTIKDKDESFIQLKSEILVLERQLENVQSKLKASSKDETLIEQECRELRERIVDNEKLLDMQISNNKELESTNKTLVERIDSLEKEMFEYKDKTQSLINSKNSELIDLRSRLSVIDQEYTDQINVLMMEKNKLESVIDIETTEAELLTMKLSVLCNKVKIVIEQKGFLLENVESCIDNLKQEWTKLKEHCQRQMVISGEKAVQQLEELLILMINSFEGVKDVIKFMSFEELDIVGFQTKTELEHKAQKNKMIGGIGIGELGDEHSVDEVESEITKSLENESVNSELELEAYHKMYEATKRKREVLNKGNMNRDKLELSALVEEVKTKNNFIKPPEPKLHKQAKSSMNREPEVLMKHLFENKPREDKNIDDVRKFIYSDLNAVDIDAENVEEFLSKNWIELMEVCYSLLRDIFLKVGNIQVSDEVTKIFTHVKGCSNKNIVRFIYERLFSKQKLALDQNWFKSKDRIETLERQKNDLKKEIMEVQDLLMAMSNQSQSITTIHQKSRQQSIDGDETNMMPTSRNVNSELKGNDTAEFGQNVKKEDSSDNTGAVKTQTLRTKQDESQPSRLVEDSKQELIKEMDGPQSIIRQKSSTTRRDPDIKTEERYTTQQSNQEYVEEGLTNFNRTISKISNARRVGSKMSQKFMRSKNKKSIKEELQMIQEIKELEKDKEILEAKNEELMERINEVNKESIKWKSIMSQKIVELEDKIKKLKATHLQEKDNLKEEYAKDLMRVSKMTKQKEQGLIENIRIEIETEYNKKLEDLKTTYNNKLNHANQKLEKVEEKFNEVSYKEKELREEYNRFMKRRELEDFKKN